MLFSSSMIAHPSKRKERSLVSKNFEYGEDFYAFILHLKGAKVHRIKMVYLES